MKKIYLLPASCEASTDSETTLLGVHFFGPRRMFFGPHKLLKTFEITWRFDAANRRFEISSMIDEKKTLITHVITGEKIRFNRFERVGEKGFAYSFTKEGDSGNRNLTYDATFHLGIQSNVVRALSFGPSKSRQGGGFALWI